MANSNDKILFIVTNCFDVPTKVAQSKIDLLYILTNLKNLDRPIGVMPICVYKSTAYLLHVVREFNNDNGIYTEEEWIAETAEEGTEVKMFGAIKMYVTRYDVKTD